MSHKPRVIAAIERYEQRQRLKDNPQPVRKNNKPEKEVESLVLQWCKKHDWDISVYEASTYDPVSRQKHTSKMEVGHSDLGGITPTGLACYIELKAKGRLNNLSENQKLFLERKIARNSFAIVTDSVERLELLWHSFSGIHKLESRRAFLTNALPLIKEKPDCDLGF